MIHIEVNEPQSDLKSGRIKTTIKHMEEAVAERLGSSERQRDAAHRRDGAGCVESAEKWALTPEGSPGED